MGEPIDLTKKLQTADGRNVPFISKRAHPICPLFGLIQEADGTSTLQSWREDGECVGEPEANLVYKPVTLRKWVCIYVDKKFKKGYKTGTGSDTEPTICTFSKATEREFREELARWKHMHPGRFEIIDERVYEHTLLG